MKKLLAVLGILTLAGSTAATLVACGGGLDTSPVTGEKIWLITDAGKVGDKSFNESGLNGGKEFKNNILNETGTIQYTEPPSLTELESAYTNAKFDGARTLILPGFHHAVEGENKAPQIMNGGSTIILDNTDGGFENQIGIMYRGDISGFLAAFGGMVQLSNNENFTGEQTVLMGTFGGSHNAGAVDNFMVGYLAAIEVYNEIVKPENENIANALGIGNKDLRFAKNKNNDNDPTGDSDPEWFTNSFSQGGATKLTESMLKQGAQIIMPVAGPQTADVLTKMGNQDPEAKKLFIIGVDTDQSKAYKESDGYFKDRFLSSAQKALVESTVIALGHSNAYVKDTKIQDQILQYATDTESNFTIEENKVFNDYNLKENKAEAWEGKTLWMGGKAASGDENQLTSDTAGKVNNVIDSDILVSASKDLFATIELNPEAKNVLSKTTISKYANMIIKGITAGNESKPKLEALNEYVDTVKEVVEGDYTPESWDPFIKALDEAKAAIAKGIELSDESLKTNLETAYNNLAKNE